MNRQQPVWVVRLYHDDRDPAWEPIDLLVEVRAPDASTAVDTCNKKCFGTYFWPGKPIRKTGVKASEVEDGRELPLERE